MQLVSICVPVYGVEKYIERCAVSLFEQTYDNIEYVFVNDQTTDRSWDVLLEVIRRYPNRISQIKLSIHEKNRGLAAVRNTAVELASGDYILWVDSDDYIEEDMVQRMIEPVVKSNADIVTCNTIVHYPDRQKYVKSPCYNSPKDMCLQLLGKRVPVSVWARLIRRSLYVENKISAKEGINNAEDYQVTPLLAFYSMKVESIDDYLYHYNCDNPTSYTSAFSEKRSNDVWHSTEILSDFFIDKGKDYVLSLNKGKADICVRDMVASCRNSNPIYYYISSHRLSGLTDESLKSLSIGFFIMTKMKKYWMGKIYVAIVGIWKFLFNRI